MATIVGRFGMSHGPQLYVPPELWPNILRRDDMGPEKPGMREQTTESMMQRRYDACLEAMDTVRTRVDEVAPDTIVLIGDDQRENLLADNTPPFLVYIGDEADASTRVSHYRFGELFRAHLTLPVLGGRVRSSSRFEAELSDADGRALASLGYDVRLLPPHSQPG